MPSNTPTTNAGNVSNSGSKAFSGQQASIYKVNFSKEQNNAEYNAYINAMWYANQPKSVQNIGTPFPNQETNNNFFYKNNSRYSAFCTNDNTQTSSQSYYTDKRFINYC